VTSPLTLLIRLGLVIGGHCVMHSVPSRVRMTTVVALEPRSECQRGSRSAGCGPLESLDTFRHGGQPRGGGPDPTLKGRPYRDPSTSRCSSAALLVPPRAGETVVRSCQKGRPPSPQACFPARTVAGGRVGESRAPPRIERLTRPTHARPTREASRAQTCRGARARLAVRLGGSLRLAGKQSVAVDNGGGEIDQFCG